MGRIFGTIMLWVALAGAALGQGAPARYAFDMSTGDEDGMRWALNAAIAMARDHAARGDPVEIRVVAHGPGLAFLRQDLSPAIKRLQFAARSMKSIEFVACEATLGMVARREGDAPPLLALAGRTPNGPRNIKELERDGWTIIRP